MLKYIKLIQFLSRFHFTTHICEKLNYIFMCIYLHHWFPSFPQEFDFFEKLPNISVKCNGIVLEVLTEYQPCDHGEKLLVLLLLFFQLSVKNLVRKSFK